MKVTEFTHAVNLRHVNEEIRQILDTPNRGQCVATLTHFSEDQHYGYGRNGASRLVSFKTTTIDAESLYIHRPHGPGRYVDILIYSRITAGQSGFGRRLTWRLLYRKGKETGFCDVYVDSFRSTEWQHESDRYLRLFDDVTREKIKADPWDFTPDESLAARVRLARKGVDVESQENAIYESLLRNGVELLDVIPFTHQLRARLDFVRKAKGHLELGWQTRGTYGSLPMTLQIQWSSKPSYKSPLLKTVRLRDLGAEVSGYYDHSENQEIHPAQVKAVKAFVKSFRRKAKGANQ